MFLKRFVFVNWGNIPQLEFEPGPINLMSGGNGSGKTTAADAIQTIMTAAHENLFQYNPGQDETTQRGRGGKRVRTLASYVLGCDDGSYARLDPTDGYLAAVFSPTSGESAEPFTAVIGVRAWLDSTAGQNVARQDDLLFLILPGEELTLEHFVREHKADKYTAPLDKITQLLIREFGKRHVQKYDTKKAYLRRLYAALRGKSDSVSEQEATAAARAFSRFMAYKPVRSINDFVAHEILERKDLGEAIRSISGQLKTIHAMERDAARLLESIDILKNAGQHADAYIQQWIELNTLDFTLAQHDYLQRQHDYLHARKKQQDYRRSLEENANETELSEQRLQQQHEQLVQLEAQRMGISALQQKDELEQKRDRQQKTLTDMARRLLVQDNALDANLQATRSLEKDLGDAGLEEDLPAIADLHVRQLAGRVVKEGNRGELDIPALLQKDMLNDLSPLEQHLDQARAAQRLHNQWYEQWHQSDSSTGNLSRYEQLAKLVHTREANYEKLKKYGAGKRNTASSAFRQNRSATRPLSNVPWTLSCATARRLIRVSCVTTWMSVTRAGKWPLRAISVWHAFPSSSIRTTKRRPFASCVDCRGAITGHASSRVRKHSAMRARRLDHPPAVLQPRHGKPLPDRQLRQRGPGSLCGHPAPYPPGSDGRWHGCRWLQPVPL